MATPTVLRLSRTDSEGDFLLLNITSNGSKPLDLKLIGTEHEHLYHVTIKESSVKSLQASNYTGNLEEWEATLRAALLHDKSAAADPNILQGLETVATIFGSTLSLTFRKNVGGIIQRLGSLALTQDDDREEVVIFEWVDAAVATSDALRNELFTLQTSVDKQRDEIAKLTEQLEELVAAKKEHEDLLMGKFVSLLNAKKAKIRDQQRLLKGAKVDASAAKAVDEARGGSHVKAGISGKGSRVSRKGKRKAGADADVVNEDGDDEGPSFEVKDEGKESEDEGLTFQNETPEETEVEDATEEEHEGDGSDADAFAPATQALYSRRAPAETGKPASSVICAVDNNKGDRQSKESPSKSSRGGQALPSRSAVPAATQAAADHDDEDETDDEL